MIIQDWNIVPTNLKSCKLIGRFFQRWVPLILPYYKFQNDFEIVLTDQCSPNLTGIQAIANYRPDLDTVFVNCPLALINVHTTLKKFQHPILGLIAHELQHREQCKTGRLKLVTDINRHCHVFFDGVRFPYQMLFSTSIRRAPWELDADGKAEQVLERVKCYVRQP